MSDEIKNISVSSADQAYAIDLGLIDYSVARDLQLRIVEARNTGLLDQDVFLILEHAPVFTLGLRGEKDHLKVPETFLASRNIPLVHIERGGDITYHGPGQLIIYPIVNLRAGHWRIVSFVESLEEIMIRIALDWGIQAERRSLNRGIWVGHNKLGSVGIAVRRSVSFHGLALNINTDLEPFQWIDPCGLVSVAVTSIQQLIGQTINIQTARDRAITHIQDVFKTKLEMVSRDALERILNH